MYIVETSCNSFQKRFLRQFSVAGDVIIMSLLMMMMMMTTTMIMIMNDDINCFIADQRKTNACSTTFALCCFFVNM